MWWPNIIVIAYGACLSWTHSASLRRTWCVFGTRPGPFPVWPLNIRTSPTYGKLTSYVVHSDRTSNQWGRMIHENHPRLRSYWQMMDNVQIWLTSISYCDQQILVAVIALSKRILSWASACIICTWWTLSTHPPCLWRGGEEWTHLCMRACRTRRRRPGWNISQTRTG